MKPQKLSHEEWLDPKLRSQNHEQWQEYCDRLFVPIGARQGSDNLEWIIDGILPKGYLSMLAGPPKSGKTSIATAMALAIASGTHFAGRAVRQGPVLWISGEESPTERHELLKLSILAQPETPLFTCYQRLNIDDEDDLYAIDHWRRDFEAQLIVIDPLLACITGRALDSSWNARRTLMPLKTYCTNAQVTALVLHHHKRREDAAGRPRVGDNDQIAATASLNYVIRSYPAVATAGPAQNVRSSAVDSTDTNGAETAPDKSEGAASPGRRASERPRASRLVSLHSAGRGVWSTQPLHFLSTSPVHYEATADIPDETSIVDDKPAWCEGSVIEALRKRNRLTLRDLSIESDSRPGTVRNILTRLRAAGYLITEGAGARRRRYSLNQEGKEFAKRRRSDVNRMFKKNLKAAKREPKPSDEKRQLLETANDIAESRC